MAEAEGRLADKDREIENLKRLLEQQYHSKEHFLENLFDTCC